jgi:predicted GIY-YIG superfamily endonuclease
MSVDHVFKFIQENPDAMPKDRLSKSRLSPHFLYIFFNVDGVAQYVGVTNCLKRRIEEHRKTSEWCKPWFREMYFLMPTRRAALSAEKHAIEIMRPKYNKMHA